MWVFTRNVLLHKTHSWIGTELIKEWATRIREYCRLMCVQCLWSQLSYQSRNVNRKWPPWIEIMCAVHAFPQRQCSYLAGLCECGHGQGDSFVMCSHLPVIAAHGVPETRIYNDITLMEVLSRSWHKALVKRSWYICFIRKCSLGLRALKQSWERGG